MSSPWGWRNADGRVRPAAPKGRPRLHRGRVHVVRVGETVHQAQVLTLTDPEALGLATGAC